MSGSTVMAVTGWAIAGLALGGGFFSLLRLNATLYGSRRWPVGIGLHLGRWALLVTALVVAARAGAPQLLLVATGIVIARALVLRGIRKVQP